MIFSLFLTIALGLLSSPDFDPVKTLPDSYTLQFENEWVKIVKVRYAPHATLPEHAHPQFATAYVYLNDADPVVFRHGNRGSVVTRPATKAGGFRLFRGVPNEVHAVENTGATASEFLRVEFKTEPKEERMLRGRFAREEAPAGENLERVAFENAQVRITRLVCAAGKSLTVAATASEPALLIEFPAGRAQWVEGGRREAIENRGAAAIELLRFDFKTPPMP